MDVLAAPVWRESQAQHPDAEFVADGFHLAQVFGDFRAGLMDVLHRRAGEFDDIVRALEALRSFTVPVYLLPANHDPLNAASVYRSPEFLANVPAHVTVLATSEPLTVTGGVAEVVGAPWESKHPLADLAGRACADLPTRGSGAPPRILVAHGAVDAGAPDTDNPALIRLAAAEAALAAGSIDYIALGDRHSTTPIGTTNRIWYSGTCARPYR